MFHAFRPALTCAALFATLLVVGCGSSDNPEVFGFLGDYANTAKGDVSLPQAGGPNPNNLPNANYVPKPLTPQGYAVALSPVTIEEVLADDTGPVAPYIELFNASDFDADIGGWVLTNGNDNFTFPYGFQVPSHGRVIIHVGESGTADSAVQFAPSFTRMDTAAGSLALLRAGNELVHFVQWGTALSPMEGAAVVAGVWQAGDFVQAATAGNAMHYAGTANDSSAWFEAAPSPGN